MNYYYLIIASNEFHCSIFDLFFQDENNYLLLEFFIIFILKIFHVRCLQNAYQKRND